MSSKKKKFQKEIEEATKKGALRGRVIVETHKIFAKLREKGVQPNIAAVQAIKQAIELGKQQQLRHDARRQPGGDPEDRGEPPGEYEWTTTKDDWWKKTELPAKSSFMDPALKRLYPSRSDGKIKDKELSTFRYKLPTGKMYSHTVDCAALGWTYPKGDEYEGGSGWHPSYCLKSQKGKCCPPNKDISPHCQEEGHQMKCLTLEERLQRVPRDAAASRFVLGAPRRTRRTRMLPQRPHLDRVPTVPEPDTDSEEDQSYDQLRLPRRPHLDRVPTVPEPDTDSEEDQNGGMKKKHTKKKRKGGKTKRRHKTRRGRRKKRKTRRKLRRRNRSRRHKHSLAKVKKQHTRSKRKLGDKDSFGRFGVNLVPNAGVRNIPRGPGGVYGRRACPFCPIKY